MNSEFDVYIDIDEHDKIHISITYNGYQFSSIRLNNLGEVSELIEKLQYFLVNSDMKH